MKALNKRATNPQKYTINSEGAITFQETPLKDLFQIASAFKLKNSFYWDSEEILNALESAIDSVKDVKYKTGLSVFLSEYLGIRLSPVVILSRTSQNLILDSDKQNVSLAVKRVFDRPDKIANSIAYAQYSEGDGKVLPPFFKRALKSALERFDPYTLRKFRLRRKVVKLADLIKLLHPRPRTAELSNLYKAIIENRKEASIEKDTVITEVLSDKNKSTGEKTSWINTNIRNIPINALLRNLVNVQNTRENLAVIEERLLNSIRVVDGIPAVKVFNPFDLLSVIESPEIKGSEKEAILNNVIDNFTEKFNLGIEGKRIVFLVDVSGSMVGSGINAVKKYFSILLPSLKNNNITIYKFDTHATKIDDFYYRDFKSINNKFKNFFACGGGTALVDSMVSVCLKHSPDLLVVFSDEISWADNYNSFDNHFYARTHLNTPVIAINPSPFEHATVFSHNYPVIKISSIDAKILYYIPMLADFKKFANWIKNLI